MASTSNAYDFDLFDSRDHGSAAPKLPEPKAPQKQKQKNNVVKLDEKQLSQEKSIAIQLEMQAASKLNTEEIEQIAREKLGMEKVADGQTSYISLTQDDEGTVVQAEKTPNLLDRIWQVLQSLFS